MSKRTQIRDKFEYGEALRRLREEAKLTQKELSEKSGVSVHTISNAESLNKASFESLFMILNALGRDFNEIIPMKRRPDEMSIIRTDNKNMRLEFNKEKEYRASISLIKKYMDNIYFEE